MAQAASSALEESAGDFIEALVDSLTRLEAIPEFPIEAFLEILRLALEGDGSEGSRKPTGHARDGRLFVDYGQMFEGCSAAIRALDSFLSHLHSSSLA